MKSPKARASRAAEWRAEARRVFSRDGRPGDAPTDRNGFERKQKRRVRLTSGMVCRGRPRKTSERAAARNEAFRTSRQLRTRLTHYLNFSAPVDRRAAIWYITRRSRAGDAEKAVLRRAGRRRWEKSKGPSHLFCVETHSLLSGNTSNIDTTQQRVCGSTPIGRVSSSCIAYRPC